MKFMSTKWCIKYDICPFSTERYGSIVWRKDHLSFTIYHDMNSLSWIVRYWSLVKFSSLSLNPLHLYILVIEWGILVYKIPDKPSAGFTMIGVFFLDVTVWKHSQMIKNTLPPPSKDLKHSHPPNDDMGIMGYLGNLSCLDRQILDVIVMGTFAMILQEYLDFYLKIFPYGHLLRFKYAIQYNHVHYVFNNRFLDHKTRTWFSIFFKNILYIVHCFEIDRYDEVTL